MSQSRDCVQCAHETMKMNPDTQGERLYCNFYQDFIKFDSSEPPCRGQDNCVGFEQDIEMQERNQSKETSGDILLDFSKNPEINKDIER